MCRSGTLGRGGGPVVRLADRQSVKRVTLTSSATLAELTRLTGLRAARCRGGRPRRNRELPRMVRNVPARRVLVTSVSSTGHRLVSDRELNQELSRTHGVRGAGILTQMRSTLASRASPSAIGDLTCDCGWTYRYAISNGRPRLWPENGSSSFSPQPLAGDECIRCGLSLTRVIEHAFPAVVTLAPNGRRGRD